ncbi:MAG TPA: hypothetical protein PKI01_12480 [Bacteroidales bacterium]|nr:hypothetical protein [Bacteroidales bacterium]
MKEINSSIELRAAILQLEIRQAEQEQMLRVKYEHAIKSLNPITILKKSFKNSFSSNVKEEGAVNSFANIIGEFASTQLLKGTTNNTVKGYLGPIIKCIIVTIINQNSEFFQAFGESIINVLSKLDEDEEQPQE